MSSLSSKAIGDLKSLLDVATSDKDTGLPCVGAVVVGNGRHWATELFEQVDDKADFYWLASCTKLVTSIACLQLVEKGVLALDDADQVERLCPELKDIRVVNRDGALEDKEGRITLRMLLTHTAGFGYSFMNLSLAKYREGQTPFDEMSGSMEDMLQPLVNQPGRTFEYGISLDWAGILLERATGQKLSEYMRESIFEPLGIEEMTMFPSKDLQARVAGLWNRGEDGVVRPGPLHLDKWFNATSPDDAFNSGGAGLCGTLRDFSKILVTLLNNGTSPTTNKKILKPSTVDDLFTNQLPDQPDFARRPLPTCKPWVTSAAPELYPFCPPSKPQGWGLGVMLSPSITGRSDTAAHWFGVSNLFWWCDREKGVAGIVGSQILPFSDPQVVELWAQVESKVYEDVSK
ncbi:CubicO group peptidase, beta-lactamase class C family [Geosmithia morbida]|uniref:CubicO group peptidase, beta-lactamase class C family n=1 Tax=Geosmithia morbida TaxID=1094350 RepID=A0A9P5D2L5_9HYPO|nr:CubicO group peptidase, beta-lactamase class C family [Geosmithia morbida]KAF4120935.1 CubicO group peptidase, beta-lactamase class C family [Geosmithia morbida]